jgi:hypothetical protein
MAIRVPSRDLYADLGVGAGATPDEISAAFRSLARTLHPDTNADPVAVDRFKVVSAAYRVLSDASERARYDAGRQARLQPASAPPHPRPGTRATAPPSRPLPPQPTVLGWEMTRKRGHWVLGAGISCLALASLVAGWVLADPHPGGGNQTGRTITLWLVAAKLLVGGAVAVWIAVRRLRNPLR